MHIYRHPLEDKAVGSPVCSGCHLTEHGSEIQDAPPICPHALIQRHVSQGVCDKLAESRVNVGGCDAARP